jgi:hypothetical protein
MGFQIAMGTPQSIWIPVDQANRSAYETLRIGQLVYSSSDGAVNLGQASGVADTSGKKIPFGVVVGHNRYNPLFDSTYMTEYITAEDPHSTTTDYRMSASLNIPVSDKGGAVKIALITPETVLRGQLFNATYGVAPTVGTVTTGSATGAGFTCAAGLCDFSTPVADLCSVYCRTGGNQGMYRVTTDTSATVKTVGNYFPNDVAAGDTFVSVPLRPWGQSYVQTDTEAMFFDVSANPATNYWIIDVIKLDLRTSGNCHVLFRFNQDHFCAARA